MLKVRLLLSIPVTSIMLVFKLGFKITLLSTPTLDGKNFLTYD